MNKRTEGFMNDLRTDVSVLHRTLAGIALCAGAFAAGQAGAGGIIAYEIGTADVGLASAGYNARAQDASTVLTNPAGMTRLEGTQFLAAGQLDYGRTEFSVDAGTSPLLGTGDGGNAFGSDGWFVGGGAFLSYSVSPDLKLGFALTGNFGAPLEYDEDWVGRYYVQETTVLGLSFLPSIAYKVNDKLSLGASLNAMYGMYENQVAINIPDTLRPGIVVPSQRAAGDAQLSLEDSTWGWGVNLGLLYEFTPHTRLGLTWSSQVDLDFSAPAEFANLGALGATIQSAGLLNATLDVGIKVPQQAMVSLFTQVNDRWALLGSVGWQQWSKFGQVQLGVENTSNPTSLTTSLDFKDTWHVAVGAQYQLSQPWLLNFGIAYDSEFQDSSNVSPLLPVNSAWRFGVGAERHAGKNSYWGIAAEYLYGGTLDTNLQSTAPVALGGRGNVAGSYDTATLFLAAYFSKKF
jgi:long-chain fatty acid transport protein